MVCVQVSAALKYVYVSVAMTCDSVLYSTYHSYLPIGHLYRVSPKWNRTFIEFSEFSKFRESEKSQKHELDQFKDPLCELCLPGAQEACWYLTQAIAGLNTIIIHKEFLQILQNLYILQNSFIKNLNVKFCYFQSCLFRTPTGPYV